MAADFAEAAFGGCTDPWTAMFQAAQASRSSGQTDLYPFWITPNGVAKIERHVLALPHSREKVQQRSLRQSVVIYRMVFGQNRQEDLVEYLLSRHSPDEVERFVDLCRIDLAPPSAISEAVVQTNEANEQDS